MTENAKKIFKFKVFPDFEVDEDKSNAEYIQILDAEGSNTVMQIEKRSINETFKTILKYYYNPYEILNFRYLKVKKNVIIIKIFISS